MSLYQSLMRNPGGKKILQGVPQHLHYNVSKTESDPFLNGVCFSLGHIKVFIICHRICVFVKTL